MNVSSTLTLLAILLVGFVVYYLFRDYLFDPSDESFHAVAQSLPAAASIEIRQPSPYPPRQVAASGPNPPSAMTGEDEAIVYAPPAPKDPYAESQEDSEIPEHLRHPERAYRPPPMNDQTNMAVQGGIASANHQMSSDQAQMYHEEPIHGGGEFMPGIFANDTMNDASFSMF